MVKIEMAEEEFEHRQQWTHVAGKVAARKEIVELIRDRAKASFLHDEKLAQIYKNLAADIERHGEKERQELGEFIKEDAERRATVKA